MNKRRYWGIAHKRINSIEVRYAGQCAIYITRREALTAQRDYGLLPEHGYRVVELTVCERIWKRT